MKCKECRMALNQGHLANAVGIKFDGTVVFGLKTPAGIKEVFHRKCYNKAQRRLTDEKRGRANRPTAYEAAATYGNADDEALAERLATVSVEEAYAAQAVHGGETAVPDDFDAEEETVGLDSLLGD